MTRSNRVSSSHDGHVNQPGQWDWEDRDLHSATLNPEIPNSDTTSDAISNMIYNTIFNTISNTTTNPICDLNTTLISNPINGQTSDPILDEVNNFYTD